MYLCISCIHSKPNLHIFTHIYTYTHTNSLDGSHVGKDGWRKGLDVLAAQVQRASSSSTGTRRGQVERDVKRKGAAAKRCDLREGRRGRRCGGHDRCRCLCCRRRRRCCTCAVGSLIGGERQALCSRHVRARQPFVACHEHEIKSAVHRVE